MNKRKAKATLSTLLKLIDKGLGSVVATSKFDSIKKLHEFARFRFEDEVWNEFYESSVRDGVAKLLRKGKVEIRETSSGKQVVITKKGKLEILKYDLDKITISKPQKWDGKWRIVFFDIEEINRGKRDKFRMLLTRLGLKRMQDSVFVYPYSLDKQIKFIREVIGVPHAVKLIVAETIENDEDLRDWFLL